MTPYLTRQAIGAMTDGRTTQAWIGAALQRAKKMPSLEEMTGRKQESKADVGKRLKMALSGLNVKEKGKR